MPDLGSTSKHLSGHPLGSNVALDILEQIMWYELDIPCGSLHILHDEYKKALETSFHICHLDSHFSYIIAPDELTSLLQLRETESANKLEFVQAQPLNIVLHVHRLSVVLRDSASNANNDFKLFFYVSDLECTQKDHIKVLLPTSTHESMMRGNFGMNFSEESIVILPDEHEMPKFFLSSEDFQKQFIKDKPRFLCSYKSVLGFVVPRHINDDASRYQEKDLGESELYALKSIPALQHPEWPKKASKFVTRPRKSGWPSSNLIEQVSSGGCHIIPIPNGGTNLEIDSDQNIEWQLNFYNAEKILFENINVVDKQAGLTFSSLVCDRLTHNHNVITEEHVKTIILWTLESYAIHTDECTHPLLMRFQEICEHFMTMLSSGSCPHYFIPEKNLFNDIPKAVLKNIHAVFASFLTQPWLLVLCNNMLPYNFYDQKVHLESMFYSESIKDEVFVQNTLEKFKFWISHINDQLEAQVWDSLLSAFNDCVMLQVVLSSLRMNYCSVDESIQLHRDVLRMVQDASLENILYAPYIDVVSSNLACLYKVMADSICAGREKEYFLIKAEALMRASKDMDKCLGRTRLANLFYSMHRYDEGINEVNDVLELLEKPSDALMYISSKSSLNVSEDFAQVLWQKWLKKQYIFDIVYQGVLTSLCPSELKVSLSLTVCGLLGVARENVSTFSPVFHNRCLLALCHLGLNSPNHGLAILQDIDAILSDADSVKTLQRTKFCRLNEKRIAGYYIALGNCYRVFHKPNLAKEAFFKSIELYPSIKNPAKILYWGDIYDEALNSIEQDVKEYVVTSAVSLGFQYFMSQI